MAESTALLAEIAAMRNQLDDVSSMTAALLRLNSDELSVEIVSWLSTDEPSRVIFLMSDGQNSQASIVHSLAEKKVSGGSAPMVTRKLEKLVSEYHLLALDHKSSGSKVYRKTEIARALHIERKLIKVGKGL